MMSCPYLLIVRLESSRGAAAGSNDYFSGSFQSDADTSGISGSELSDAALSELMVRLLFLVLIILLLV